MIDFTWSRREKILAGTLVVISISLLVSLFWSKKSPSVDPLEGALQKYEQEGKGNLAVKTGAEVQPSTDAWVDVKGAVHKPGIYKVKSDARVFEVIQQAGGTLPSADLNQMNQAQVIVDGTVLYVPKIGEDPSTVAGIDRSSATTQSSGSGPKVNINTATEQELTTLQGIGSSKAQAILQYRKEHGRFSSIEDLKKISGLGEKTIAKFKDRVTVG